MQDQAYAASEAKIAREATLNERLNRVGEQFNSQCDRIEGVLSRVNGTPQPPKTGDRIGEARRAHCLAATPQRNQGRRRNDPRMAQ